MSPILKWAGIWVSPILKRAGVCVSPIKKKREREKWAGIYVNPIIKRAGICDQPDHKVRGYLCEPCYKVSGYLCERDGLVRSRFSEVHCETLFQKVWVDLQSQKRCISVSVESAQKEHESVSFLPILRRKSFVTILLCRNLNWNALYFVSIVYKNGSW